MKSFHKTMGFLSSIFLIMIIGSISVSSSYMKRNDISFPELFNGSSSIDYNSTSSLNFWDSSNQSSSYETLTINESENFDLVEEIFVSASIEEVVFIQENRDDILVNYYREKPDTQNYDVDYKTNISNNKLSISATLKSKSISINKAYKGTIKIYVPIDYKFNKVTIDSGAAKITSGNIYTNTDSLSVIASFGDIDISIDSPIDEVNISCNFGSIEVEVNDQVNDLDVTCDLGKIDLTLNDDVSSLTVSEDMGDVDIYANSSLGSVDISNSMGGIKADFLENVDKVSIENDMGDINVSFFENEDMTIYVDTDLGSIDSDFPLSTSNTTNFEFTSDMGSIRINNK